MYITKEMPCGAVTRARHTAIKSIKIISQSKRTCQPLKWYPMKFLRNMWWLATRAFTVIFIYALICFYFGMFGGVGS